MSKTLSVNIDDELDELLIQSSAILHKSKGEIINMALRQYLYLQKSRTLRKKMQQYVEKAGLSAEEDLYREVS